MKQIIIVRKDLQMSPGKMSAQVGHASMAYFMYKIKQSAHKTLAPNFECFRTIDGNHMQWYKHPDLAKWCQEAYDKGLSYFYCEKIPDKNGYHLVLVDKNQVQYEYVSTMSFDADIYENWINGIFTKVVLETKNKNQLLKAVDKAKELGMVEGKDYFIIKDNCLTELEPEEVDENGIGRTITCIGFKPMENEVIDQICKKYQVYK